MVQSKKINQTKDFNLHSGRLCKLEKVNRHNNTLKIDLTKTTYREYIGTRDRSSIKKFNIKHQYLANSLAVCSVLISSDSKIILTKRNPKFVESKPDYYHVIGGFMHQPRTLSPDPFTTMQRELKEELGVTLRHVDKITCMGLVYDLELFHPELVMETILKISATDLINNFKQSKLNKGEVGEIIVLNNSPEELYCFISEHNKKLAPTGEASLFLYGAQHFGNQWRADIELELTKNRMKK